MAKVKQFYQFILAYFFQGTEQVKANKKRRRDEDTHGRWTFKKDILDKLDDYFRYIKYMKKYDREAYVMYSKIGASIIPDDTKTERGRLPTSWHNPKKRPGFGAVAYLQQNDDVSVSPKFAYFRKLSKTPCNVLKPVPGDLYELTNFVQDTYRGDDYGHPIIGYVVVTADSAVVPAKYWYWKKHFRSQARVKKATYGLLLDKALDKGWPVDGPQSVEEQAAFILSSLAGFYEQSHSGIRVAAAKNRVTAVFSVDMLRTPYFFADRIPVYADEGHKKKIFHIVRTHKRETQTGTTYVKSHFRGLRDFNWNGHCIHLSMSLKHHADVLDFEAGGEIVLDGQPTEEGYIDSGQLGTIMGAHFNG